MTKVPIILLNLAFKSNKFTSNDKIQLIITFTTTFLQVTRYILGIFDIRNTQIMNDFMVFII